MTIGTVNALGERKTDSLSSPNQSDDMVLAGDGDRNTIVRSTMITSDGESRSDLEKWTVAKQTIELTRVKVA
jgi:hypothetical protein